MIPYARVQGPGPGRTVALLLQPQPLELQRGDVLLMRSTLVLKLGEDSWGRAGGGGARVGRGGDGKKVFGLTAGWWTE